MVAYHKVKNVFVSLMDMELEDADSYYTYSIHFHNVSSTDFILLGVNIAILLLPVISKLKVGDVEIEIPVESKGNQIYQLMPLPNSVMRRDVSLHLDFGLFIVDLWY